MFLRVRPAEVSVGAHARLARRKRTALAAVVMAMAWILNESGSATAQSAPSMPARLGPTAVEDGVRRALDLGPVDIVVELIGHRSPNAARETAAVRDWAARQREIARQVDDVTRLVPGVLVRQRLRNVGVMALRLDNVQQLDAVSRIATVRSIGLDRQHTPLIDPHLALISQPQVAADGFTGSGTVVAVLDSGVDYTLPVFGGCTAPGPGCRILSSVEIAANDGVADDSRHGTRISNVIARTAPAVSIIVGDVMSGGVASTSSISAGVDWVISQKLSGVNVVALNISLGFGAFANACTDFYGFADLIAVGITPVAASGNSGNTAGVASPSCVPGTISVGAVTAQPTITTNWGGCVDSALQADKIPCFSQSGPLLTMLAPGVNVMLDGGPRSGTSFASPFVAAALAVVTSARPAATQPEVVHAVTLAGPLVTDARNGKTVHRLDLQQAVTSVLPPSGMVSLPLPVRFADTRTGFATVDGQFAGGGPRLGGTAFAVTVASRGGVHTTARAAMLNVAVVEPTSEGYLTVFPCGGSIPNASTVNYTRGATVANSAIARIGANGQVCFFVSSTTELIVDVASYFPDETVYSAIPSPARLLDTRPGFGTIDGQFAGIGEQAAGTTLNLLIAGRPGVALGERLVSLNLAAVSPASPGWITVFPCGQPVPLASNLNFSDGQTIANHVVAKTDASGQVCIYFSSTTHAIVDVVGYFVSGFTALASPARVIDTRPGSFTIDGLQAGGGTVQANSVQTIQIAQRSGIPNGISSIVLTVTIVDPLAEGWVTVVPCGEALPNASSINYSQGQTIAGTVISRLNASGQVCVFSSATTHVLADVSAFRL
jgi:Subtilase family